MTATAVVVGGGVAGCAAASRLAAAGWSVTVLEREPAYTDKVRGEGMVPWGFEQAAAMGLGDIVLGTPGCSAITRLMPYDETVDVAAARRTGRDLSAMLPGAPGIVAVGHPELREALAGAAVAAGARLLRGVRGVEVSPGPRPRVRWTAGGAVDEQACDVVLAADGKDSAVRRGLGIELAVGAPRMTLTGLLADDGGVWDRTETTIAVVGGSQLYVIPRAGGLLRLYVGRLSGGRVRFTGPDRVARFLGEFAVDCLPYAAELSAARPAGPIATFPMTDSWTDEPFAPGVLLLGDAAGWSNPVTGQGLAVAFRDAQILTDLLLEAGGWTAAAARSYAAERAERMRRLRFASALTDLVTALGTDDRAGWRRRVMARLAAEPELGAAFEAVHRGPWRVPAEAFTPSILTTLALAGATSGGPRGGEDRRPGTIHDSVITRATGD